MPPARAKPACGATIRMKKESSSFFTLNMFILHLSLKKMQKSRLPFNAYYRQIDGGALYHKHSKTYHSELIAILHEKSFVTMNLKNSVM